MTWQVCVGLGDGFGDGGWFSYTDGRGHGGGHCCGGGNGRANGYGCGNDQGFGRRCWTGGGELTRDKHGKYCVKDPKKGPF
jgi:hypothetical protein